MVERSTGAQPSGPRAAEPHDGGEVTLRQLYLTFKAGLWLIVVVGLVCGVAAFLIAGAAGPRYVSAATVTVTPPAVGVTSLTGLDVSVPATLDFEAYRAIAFDPELLRSLDRPEGTDPVALLGYIDLVSRTPASQVRGHVTVDHVVTGGASGFTKEDAVRLANAWAEATVSAVTAFLTAPVDDAIDSVTAEIATRTAEFDAASAAWAEFLGVDERRSLNERLDALTRLDSVQRTRLAMLEGAVAAADARTEALQAALEQGSTGSSQTATQLVADQLAVLLGERAALQAERDHLATVVQQTAGDASELRARLTDLESRAASLQRDLAAASMTFYRIAPAGPSLQLQRDLASRSALVAVAAAEPLMPEPRGRVVAAVAAAAVGALFTTLFVFLRAAVREPER